MARRTQVNKGSFGSASNYNRLVQTFGPAGTTTVAGRTDITTPVPAGWHQDPAGQWYHWDGTQWQASPPPPPTGTTATGQAPVSDAPAFTVAGVFDKVGLLLLLAVASGIVTAIMKPPLGVLWVAIFAALGVGLWTSFRPRVAHVTAPIYALLEGAAIGVVSSWYGSQGRLVVPVAVIGTVAIVLAVWGLFRSGLVRVGARMAQVTLVAGIGLCAAMLGAIVLNLQFNSVGGILIFGVLYLIFAVMSLFVDFDYAVRAQAAGVSQEGEWFSAFSIMIATIMVYLALLRILAGGRR